MGEIHDEGQEPVSWQEVAMEAINSKEFISFLDRSIDKFISVSQRRIDIESIKASGWERVNKLFILLRFCLSFVVLIGLWLTLRDKLLPVELAVPLLAIVIGSLFVSPKKE